MATAYSNIGGSGPRAGIVASTTAGVNGGIAYLVSGAYQNVLFFNPNSQAVSGLIIKFDFNSLGYTVVIDEAKWYQDVTTSHGVWQWQGSPDNISWTNIGATFTLGGATTQTQVTLNGNVTAYRYYRLLGVSGNVSSTPFLQGIDFKISAPPPATYVSKLEAQAALVSPLGVSISKAIEEAALLKAPGVNVSKLLAEVVLQVGNVNPPVWPPVWPAVALPNGYVGNPYSTTWDLTPAAAPTTYTVVAGSLPPGLTLNNVSADVGSITGTPTLAGVYGFTMRATNSFGTADKAFTITITGASGGPPIWPSFTMPTGYVALAYAVSWDLAPATAPTTYTVVSGSLPPGLTLNNVSGDVGSITGTPTTIGAYPFTLRATNSFGTADKAFTIMIASAGGGAAYTYTG